MTDTQANEVVNEQATDNLAAEKQPNPTQESQSQDAPKEGSKEFNFRQLEESKKEVEQKLQAQEAMNREILAALKTKEQPKPPTEEVLPQLNPDDIPDVSYVERRAAQIAEKKVREILAKQEQERLPDLVKKRYPDFDEVVSKANIEKFEKENPDLARAFSQAKDPYTATYTYLKATQASKKPKDPVAMEEAEKIKENENKPVSANAVGRGGALKSANAFQKRSKEDLYAEMQRCAAG